MNEERLIKVRFVHTFQFSYTLHLFRVQTMSEQSSLSVLRTDYEICRLFPTLLLTKKVSRMSIRQAGFLPFIHFYKNK